MARDANTNLFPPAAVAVAASARPSRPPPSRSMSPLPQTHHLHYPPQPLYTAQQLPIPTPNQQLPVSQQDQSHGILYPLVSSGQGFMSRAIRSFPTADQAVTVANPGGYGPRPVVGFPPGIRPDGSSHLDYLVHPMQILRVPNLHQLQHNPPLGSAAKGVSPKVGITAAPSSFADCNGYNDMRNKVNDETFVIVRDRKVRISEDSSLYSLCRSWLRNGFHEENQPNYVNRLQPLPKPLPIALDNNNLLQKKEDKEEEEDVEESVEHLTPQDLLKSHIGRAKRVRARLREERLRRIDRFKPRLALLLPPPAEQFRSDIAAGN